MPPPKMGDELLQFICAANWMRSAIPDFNRIIAPLSELIERVHKLSKKRTKKSASRIHLESAGWSNEHTSSFVRIKEAIKNAVTLAHIDMAKIRCLFTDASEDHWGAVLTQIPITDSDLAFAEQRHEPIAFLSGSFKGSDYRWSMPEKEAFAIIASVKRL
eukprot:IDg872t1